MAKKKTTPTETAPKLRLDGPTLEQYVAAGYFAENYPPAGYAPRDTPYEAPVPVIVRVTGQAINEGGAHYEKGDTFETTSSRAAAIAAFVTVVAAAAVEVPPTPEA